MSYEESLRSISLNADSTLATYTGVPGLPGSADPNGGKIYRFVKVTGVNQVGLADADDVVIGVLQNKPQVTGQSATVAIRGVSNLTAGGVIAAGDELVSDASGKAVKAGAGVKGLAIALTAATADGHLVSALLRVN